MRTVAAGMKAGKLALSLSARVVLRQAVMSQEIAGLKLGLKIGIANGATKQGRMVKKNGVKNGVNQAKNLGVRSGRASWTKIWLGEKTGEIEARSIGMSGGVMMTRMEPRS